MAKHKNRAAKGGFRLADLDMCRTLDKADYEERLEPLQFRLRAIELAYRRFGHRALIVLEGWDAGGKGGVIRRLTASLDPRGCKVWPIAALKPEEQGRHYLYRFWQRLPEPGTLAVFDRSWYGRVLVERVEALIPEKAWRRAYDEINDFERMLAEDGARVVKIFLHVTADEQLRRFQERLRNPYKQWKLTPEDLRNRRQWAAYEEAIEEMVDRTSTAAAAWHVLPANDKRHARVAALEIVAEALSADVDTSPPPLEPEIARLAREELGLK